MQTNVDPNSITSRIGINGLILRESALEAMGRGNTDLYYVDALNVINEISLLDENYHLSSFVKGQLNYKLRKFDEALIDFEQHIISNKSDFGHNFLGYVYEVMGESEKAREIYKQYVEIKKDGRLFKLEIDRINNHRELYKDDPEEILNTLLKADIADELFYLCAFRIGRIGDCRILNRLCDLFYSERNDDQTLFNKCDFTRNENMKKFLSSVLLQTNSSECIDFLVKKWMETKEENLAYSIGMALARKNYPDIINLLDSQHAISEINTKFDILSFSSHPGKIEYIKNNRSLINPGDLCFPYGIFGTIRNDESAKLIFEIEKDGDFGLSYGANEGIIALIKIGSDICLDYARRQLINDPDAQTRQILLEGIKLYGDKRCKDMVSVLLTDSSHFVRRSALFAAFSLIFQDYSLLNNIKEISNNDTDSTCRAIANDIVSGERIYASARVSGG